MQKREKENADDIKALRSVYAGAYYGVIRYFFYSGKCKRFHRRADMGGRLHGGNGGEGDGVLFWFGINTDVCDGGYLWSYDSGDGK